MKIKIILRKWRNFHWNDADFCRYRLCTGSYTYSSNERWLWTSLTSINITVEAFHMKQVLNAVSRCIFKEVMAILVFAPNHRICDIAWSWFFCKISHDCVNVRSYIGLFDILINFKQIIKWIGPFSRTTELVLEF